jgi:20S proteasome alpha/beta subunit
MLKRELLKRRWKLNPRQSKTYIIGIRCKDGVVLVSDSVVTRGTDTSSEDKILLLPTSKGHFVFGASGTTGFFDKFLLELQSRIDDDAVATLQDVLYTVDGALMKINQLYGGTDIEVLIALQGEKSMLFHAINTGYSEEVKSHFVIGHGEPYGSLFTRNLIPKNPTITQAVEFGVMIVEFFNRFKLDTSVGGDAQVWIVPDLPENIRELTEEQQKKYYIRRLTKPQTDNIIQQINPKLEILQDALEKMK